MKKNWFQNTLVVILIVADLVLIAALVILIKMSSGVSSEVASYKNKEKEMVTAESTIRGFDEKQTSAAEDELERRIPAVRTSHFEGVHVARKIAAASNISTMSVKTLDNPSDALANISGIKAAPFESEFFCEYKDLVGFMEKLSASERLILVESLTVQRKSERIPFVRVEMVFNAFTLANEKGK